MRDRNSSWLSRFLRDCRRDWDTIRSLRGKKLAEHLLEYYTVPLLVTVFVLFAVGTMARLLWQGQQPRRLQVCVVLNSELSCKAWFDDFSQELRADGKPGAVELNEDQSFDYDNRYYQVQEASVMALVSSGRMDAAVCGEDLYSYLLALNACMDLRELWPEGSPAPLAPGVAGLTGEPGEQEGVEGCYALDLTGTAFGARYNRGGEDGALYAVVISNTEHLEDVLAFLRAVAAPA